MAKRSEIELVYLAGLVQGVALVTFFTSPHPAGYGFSNSQYGAMFLPQVVLAFGLAGLACSAFFPLSISFGGEEFPRLTAVVSGELIAFYQVGYGIAAFGVGPLRDYAGVALSTIYAAGSLVAAAMIVLAFFVIRPQTRSAAQASA